MNFVYIHICNYITDKHTYINIIYRYTAPQIFSAFLSAKLQLLASTPKGQRKKRRENGYFDCSRDRNSVCVCVCVCVCVSLSTIQHLTRITIISIYLCIYCIY